MRNNIKKGPFLFPVRDAADDDKVTLVPVSEEFYRETYRKVNRKRKRLQRNGECRCYGKMRWRCDGGCERCCYYIEKQPTLSLDAPVTDDENISLMDTIADDALLPEDVVADKELLVALFRELEKLDDSSRRICELMSLVSEREAAKQLGIPRSTFKYQWAKIQAMLREKLKDYR